MASKYRQAAREGNPGVPVEAIDELDEIGLLHRTPWTLSEAKKVLSIKGRWSKDTLKPPATIDGKARAAKRTAKAKQRADRATRGLRSSGKDERRGDRIAAGKWRKGVGIRVSPCIWPECGLLVFKHTSLTTETQMHQPCMTAAMRSKEGSDWQSSRKTDRNAGIAEYVINRRYGTHLPITGRPDADTLTARSEVPSKQLAWAVRHLLGTESQQALANEDGVTRQAVSQGIERVLGLLPPDELVPKYYRQLVGRLRLADQRRRRD